ncbi:hypothetical protein [Pseudonocardia aurantiaca]|uniref:Uncharacterized protein n=1 Tax=Pseudonocardia aurantiaca TaxID=75290 RepID=A0ABW4FQ58_9PSEU
MLSALGEAAAHARALAPRGAVVQVEESPTTWRRSGGTAPHPAADAAHRR